MSVYQVHASLDCTDSFDEFFVLMGQHIHKGITESDNVKI